ncbi:MAG: hypothetical protein ACREXM_14885 [Gammaproteobacteria bacterium]
MNRYTSGLIGRWTRVALTAISFAATTSGCATWLGYVPEHVRPGDNITQAPSYAEVKEWAYDVIDGYDTRATINRQSLYAGALLAAAAVGAVTGLSAFGSDSAALVGIPIGTTFLAGVAAVYSSEEKARIYRFASAYLKDLLTMSDRRLRQCTILASTSSKSILADAEQAMKVAKTKLREAREQEKYLLSQVKSARNQSDGLTSNEKAAQHKVNGALDQEHGKARDATLKAEAALLGARNDFNDVTRCSDPRIASTGFEKAVQEGEALCLRDDVNDVMRRVEAHIALLDPRNVADRLRSAVRAPATSIGASEPTPSSATATSNDAATGTEPVVAAAATDDLSDLISPIQSRCGYF